MHKQAPKHPKNPKKQECYEIEMKIPCWLKMVINVGITMFVTIFMLQNQVILDTLHFYGKEGKEQQSVAPSNLISFFILSFRYTQGGSRLPCLKQITKNIYYIHKF